MIRRLSIIFYCKYAYGLHLLCPLSVCTNRESSKYTPHESNVKIVLKQRKHLQGPKIRRNFAVQKARDTLTNQNGDLV